MKTKIPKKVIDVINTQIANHPLFGSASAEVKNKVYTKAINLWYYIYSRQLQDELCHTLNWFVHISKKDLDIKQFSLKHLKKEYCYTTFIKLLEPDLIIVNKDHRFFNPKGSQKPDGIYYTMSYRINYELMLGEFAEVDIDATLLTLNCKDKQYWLNIYPQYGHLIEDTYNTTIDIDAYRQWLYDNEGEELKGRSFKEHWDIDGKHVRTSRFKKRFLDKRRISEYLNDAIKHNGGSIWFKVSDEGRFYSSLGNISSTAKNFMLLYGKPLKSIDIPNCQPLLLSSLVDQPQFKADTQASAFYKNVATILGKEIPATKNMLYKYFLFTNTPLRNGALYKAISALYPGLVEQVNKLKETISLPHYLQQIEAKIMVEGAGKLNFSKLLRHDEILFHEENYTEAKQFLVDEFAKLGLQLDLKTKD